MEESCDNCKKTYPISLIKWDKYVKKLISIDEINFTDIAKFCIFCRLYRIKCEGCGWKQVSCKYIRDDEDGDPICESNRRNKVANLFGKRYKYKYYDRGYDPTLSYKRMAQCFICRKLSCEDCSYEYTSGLMDRYGVRPTEDIIVCNSCVEENKIEISNADASVDQIKVIRLRSRYGK